MSVFRVVLRIFLSLAVSALGVWLVIASSAALGLLDLSLLRERPSILNLVEGSTTRIEHAVELVARETGSSSKQYLIGAMGAGLLICSAMLYSLITYKSKPCVDCDKRRRRDPLFENKLIALCLVSALIVIMPPIVAEEWGTFNNAADHVHANDADPSGEKPISDAVDSQALAIRIESADPVIGAQRARLCISCHSFQEGEPHRLGPNLWSVIGADIASKEGYRYSPALSAKEGSWTYAALDAYLENSQMFAPGGVMNQRIVNKEHRADIVRYLDELK